MAIKSTTTAAKSATRKLTEVQALVYAVALAKGEPMELPEGVTPEDAIAKLEHMRAAKAKLSASPKTKRVNTRMIECAKAIASKMNAGEPYDVEGLRDLIDREHIFDSAAIMKYGLGTKDGVITSQQLTAIMREGVAQKLVRRVAISKAKSAYYLEGGEAK